MAVRRGEEREGRSMSDVEIVGRSADILSNDEIRLAAFLLRYAWLLTVNNRQKDTLIDLLSREIVLLKQERDLYIVE